MKKNLWIVALGLLAMASSCGKSVGGNSDGFLGGQTEGCPLGDNPLANYSVFSRGQLILENIESEGQVAGFHPAFVSRSKIGTNLVPNGERVDLASDSELEVLHTSVPHGKVVARTKLRATQLDAPYGASEGNVDWMIGLEYFLKGRHKSMLELAPAGSSEFRCTAGSGRCELEILGENSLLNVVDVDADEFRRAKKVTLNVYPGSQLVIRIQGKKEGALNIVSQELDVGTLAPERITWVVSGVERIVAHGRHLPGTWVAPNTKFNANHAHFMGGLYSSCVFANGSKFHLLPSASGCVSGRQ